MRTSTDYYDEAYFLERQTLPTHLLNTIQILLKETGTRKILEVGVGAGKLMKTLRESGYEVEGIDISPVSAKLTGATVASATDIPFEAKSFDCLISDSVIEHLTKEEGEKFIQESWRVLKNGGTIFLVTPNLNSPMRFIKKDKWFGYNDKSHIFFYTPGSLTSALRQEGFENIRSKFKIQSSSIEWPLPFVFRKLPPSLKLVTNKVLVSSPLAAYRDTFWIAATKGESRG